MLLKNAKKNLRKYKFAFGKKFSKMVQESTQNAPRQLSIFQFRKDYLRYGVLPDEFVKYSFYNKNSTEKKEYMPHKEEIELFSHGVYNRFPRNKYIRYELFSKFFQRDIICISQESEHCVTEKEYQLFCTKNKFFIIKPVKGTEGRGIQIVSSQNYPTLASIIESEGNDMMIEAIISQGDELAQFHPESVNTIRFVSVLNSKGEYSPLYALFRCGRGKSVVDNVGSGGLVAMLDLNSGVICTDAICGIEHYAFHPDTKVRFQGFSVPKWKELCSLAESAHRTMPEQRLIGWDFAWTKNQKWDLVEANPCPSFISYQTLMKRRIRPELKRTGILD